MDARQRKNAVTCYTWLAVFGEASGSHPRYSSTLGPIWQLYDLLTQTNVKLSLLKTSGRRLSPSSPPSRLAPMFVEFAGPVLNSIPSLVVKYGAIWLALYAVRHLIVLLVSAQHDLSSCDHE